MPPGESTPARAALRAWLLSGDVPVPESNAHASVLASAAADQGVAGLLDEAVSADERWPAETRAALRDLRRALLRRGARQLDLAERAREILAKRGLRALPLKGAGLSERLYASPADRPMADVDLLALDDAEAARRVLLEHGFEPLEHADHAWSACERASGLTLELHRGLTSCPELHPVDAEGLWKRSTPGGGVLGRVPSAEDMLVHLALHAAFQHGLVVSLVQWLDVRRLLDRLPLDARRLVEAARAARAQAALGAMLACARAVVGAEVPEKLRAALALPEALERRLGARLRQPLECVAPARAPLLRLRWELSLGQRGAFVRASLFPRTRLGIGASARRYGRLARRLLPLLS